MESLKAPDALPIDFTRRRQFAAYFETGTDGIDFLTV